MCSARANLAKRMECVQLAAAFERFLIAEKSGLAKAAASCTHSIRFARLARPKHIRAHRYRDLSRRCYRSGLLTGAGGGRSNSCGAGRLATPFLAQAEVKRTAFATSFGWVMWS